MARQYSGTAGRIKNAQIGVFLLDSDTVFGVSGSLVVSPRTGLPDSPRPDLPGIRHDSRLSHAAEAAPGAGRVGSDPSELAPVPA